MRHRRGFRAARWVRGRLQDRRGVAALEFAVIASLMVVLMLGTYDFGNAAQQEIALQEAVRSGGAYAQSYPTDPTGMQNAVVAALPPGWKLSNSGGVPVISCTCNGATVTCTNPGSCTPPFLVSITATMAYQALTPLFANALPNLTAAYVTRIQ